MQTVSTCLWFDTQAEDAANFYVSLFPNSRIVEKQVWPEGSPRAGQALTVAFSLDGAEYLALNGGPEYQHTPAMSMMANCRTQEEVDRLWAALTEGGQESRCGWLTDRYGVSWQVVPQAAMGLLFSADKAASQRAFQAMMQMVKLDLPVLQRAHDGR